MSNVLIGIIGVILFIGLALAGALFLGPRFQQSSNAAKAASVMVSLDQMSNAMTMHRTLTGIQGDSGRGDYLVTEGYLKAIPPFVLDPENGFYNFRDASGTYAGPAAYALAGLDSGSATHMNVCREINRITRDGASDGTPIASDGPPGSAGCFLVSNMWGGLPNGLLIVYKRV